MALTVAVLLAGCGSREATSSQPAETSLAPAAPQAPDTEAGPTLPSSPPSPVAPTSTTSPTPPQTSTTLASTTATSATPAAPPVSLPSATAADRRDPNYRKAVAEAEALLAAARLPPAATPLAGDPPAALRGPALGTPSTDHLVDGRELLSVRGSLLRTAAWISAHPPTGLTSAGSGSSSGPGGVISEDFEWSAPATDAYEQPELEIGLATGGPGRTTIRVDGVDVWISSTPAPDTRGGPRVRVELSGGCPASLASAIDVANPDPALRTRMLPAGRPTAGLVCSYQAGGTRAMPLTRSPAAQLARAVDAVDLGSSGSGATSCPADEGSIDIIVLAFAGHPDADLWYSASGCQSLDNGDVMGGQVGNVSFGSFQTVFDSVTRTRS